MANVLKSKLVKRRRVQPRDEADEGRIRLALQYESDASDAPPGGMVCSARLGKGETLL